MADVEWDMLTGVEALPVRVESGGPRRGAPLVVRLAFFVAVLAAVIVFARPFGGPRAKVAVSVIVGATAILWVLTRAHARSVRRLWAFTPTEVEFAQHSALRSRAWTEPLSAYKGVLGCKEWRGRGEDVELWHILTLQHRTDPRRTVKLYESLSAEGFRSRHEHAARLFGLPYLLQTDGGVQERVPEDLDKSVREQVAAGDLEVPADLGAPPGDALVVRRNAGALTMSTGRQMLGPVGAAIGPFVLAVGVAVVLVCVCAGLPVGHWAVQLGAAYVVLGGTATAVSRCLREELAVSAREVGRRLYHPWGVLKEESVPADAVEEVVIGSALPGSPAFLRPVRVITDSSELRFGWFLPQAAKEWARDCIVAVIARGALPDASQGAENGAGG